MAANIIQYDDRAAFLADTSGRTVTDFETLRNACIAIPDAGGVTVNGVNLNGGVARLTSSGPCRAVADAMARLRPLDEACDPRGRSGASVHYGGASGGNDGGRIRRRHQLRPGELAYLHDGDDVR